MNWALVQENVVKLVAGHYQKEPKLLKTLFKSQALCNLVKFEHVQKAKAKF